MNTTTAPAIFQFNTHEVRTVVLGDAAWFVAADACAVLGIQNPTDAIKRLDDDERARFNLGQQGDVNIISESGLYALVLRSRKPEAVSYTHLTLPTKRIV